LLRRSAKETLARYYGEADKTGYESKRAAARDKLEDDDTQVYQTELTKLLMESYDKGVADALEETKAALAHPAQEHVAVQHHDDTLTIAYQSGFYDGKKAAQPAQEPVAWLCKADKNGMFGLPTADKACKDCFPVYTAPQQRPWVGLTDEEVVNLGYSADGNVCTAVRLAAVYIKEKNNGTTP